MTQPVMLHPQEHKDLRVMPERGAALGDDVMLCATFPLEFRDVQAHYPIVFRKTAQAPGYEALALFGFEDGENLFLAGDGAHGWDASYVPLAIRRQPFLIGRSSAQPGAQLQIHIDLDHPRVSRVDGEALFLRYGGTSETLEAASAMLSQIHAGMQAMPGFVQALTELELLEPFALDIELKDGSQHRLEGFETIDEDRLLALPGAVLERLNRAGYLQAIHMAMASLTQFRELIARRERRHAART